MARIAFSLFLLSMLAGCITPVGSPPSVPASRSLAGVSPPAPRAGDTAVYVVRNAYNGEPRGDIQYRVDKVEGDRAIVGVTTTSPYAGLPHTEIDAPFGNWLRRPLATHNQPVEYDFTPAFPAYPFPLDAGKSWSTRVNAVNPQANRRNSVRVDGQVLGYERITVPAGSFDVVVIRRNVYGGDFEAFLQETHVVETDWYSPELGRSVRLETNSSWIDSSRGGGGMLAFSSNQLMRGDWNVYELVSYDVNGKRGGPVASVPPPPPPPR